MHEFSGKKLLDPTIVSNSIVVSKMKLVGNYGLSIGFSDGHATGIYRFDDLYENRSPGK